MSKTYPEIYKSDLIEELLSEITPKQQKNTDRKMMLAARIVDAMRCKGLKKGELAKALNKRPSEITKWLSGTHNFTSETLWQIEDILGIELVNLGSKTKERVVYVAYANVSQDNNTSNDFFNEEAYTLILNQSKQIMHN